MVGKFFVVALVCVSLTQVHGDILDDAIRRGLNRLRGLNDNGVRRIESALREVDYKRNLIESRTSAFIEKSLRTEAANEEKLTEVADNMEEKAQELNKPPSVLNCIRRVLNTAITQIETFTDKLRTDLERLESTKLANIETDSRPLDGLRGNLEVSYQRAVEQVRNCKTPSCVDIAVNSFSRGLDQVFANIRRILGQIATILTNFQRDASNYFNNTNRQVSRVTSVSIRNIRECVYNRNVFENFLKKE